MRAADAGDRLHRGWLRATRKVLSGGDDHAGDDVAPMDGGQRRCRDGRASRRGRRWYSMPTAPARNGTAATHPLRARERWRCVLQVSRQPREVEPHRVVDAAPAEHHAPDRALADGSARHGGLGRAAGNPA